MADANCKIKDLRTGTSPARRYCALTHGEIPLWQVLRNEVLVLFFGYIPGPVGLALRAFFYPCMFGHCGRKVVFGRAVTFRHASKISLGDGCILDDDVTIDAKGTTNKGIVLGDGVYVGRRTTIYCKNGEIVLGPRVNVSSNCTLFSSNRLEIGEGCMIGAYSYFLSGGEYDYKDPAPYCEQSGMCTKGPLVIGPDCWFGTRVTVLDAAGSVGERSVVAACALVTRPVLARTLVGGIPAKVLKRL